MIPTVIHARICVIKSKTPIAVFLNIRTPTVPIIKRGPELFVKLSNLSHSSLVQILLILKFEAIFAPIGYPLIMPIIKAKEPSPRILKSGFIYGFNIFPNQLMILVCINNSVATKNGNNEGTTEFAHNDRPDLTAGRLVFEKNSKQNVKSKNINVKKFLFIFIA